MNKLFALFLVLMLLCSCAVSEVPEVSETSEEDEFTEEYYDRKFMDEVVTDEGKRGQSCIYLCVTLRLVPSGETI